MNKTFNKLVFESNNKAVVPMDKAPIHEWCEKYVTLTGAYAQSGRFRLGKTRYLLPILEAIKDERIREVCILASTQGGKSLVMDLSLIWSIANRPGPSMWVMQSNQVAEEHLESRIIPSLKATDIVRGYLPSYNKISTDNIQFSHMPLFCHGPGERRLQSKSIMNVYCSEVWQYENGTMEFIRKRTKQFLKYGMSKIILESQGGEEDGDLDLGFKRGTMEYFNVPCPHCNKLFIPSIDHMNCKGQKWNDPKLKVKGDDGEYDYKKLEDMLTMQCPHCAGLFKDSESVKVKWANEGKYLQTNMKALSGHRSFSFNAFLHDPWFDIVYEFIEASHLARHGANANLINFFRSRMAKIVSEATLDTDIKFVNLSEYDIESPFPKDELAAIFLTVDVQEAKYVGVIRAWDKRGNSRLMWHGEMYGADEIEEMRKKYNIPPHYVAMDSGGNRTRETYSICLDKGYLAIKGVKDKRGFMKTTTVKIGKMEQVKKSWKFWCKSETGGDPAMGTAQQGKVGKAKAYLFCVNPIKDILSRLRDGKTSNKWEVCGKPEDLVEYNKQIYGEKVREVMNRYGKVDRFWMPIKHGMVVDYLDCETYNLGLALMHPLIPIKESIHSKVIQESPATDVSSNILGEGKEFGE